MRMTLRLATAAALAGILAACSSDGSGPTSRNQVTFNLASGSSAGSALLMGDTVANATDTLVLDSVQIVLRDIKFQRVNEDACDNEHNDDGDDDHHGSGDAAGGIMPASMHDGGNDDGDDGQSDACESFNAGPFLLNVPLGPEVVRAFSVAVDTGTFDQVRFKIHKPRRDSGDTRDVDFLNAHPEFDKVSIRVVGTFNGAPFVFTTDLNAQQRMALSPPIVVADSVQNVDVTIKVDLAGWFRNGDAVISPETANKGGDNEHLVKDNIQDSFHAFCDHDRDGHEDTDHGEHH